MQLDTILVVNAVVALAYAAGLLLVPAMLSDLYGLTSGASEQLMARFFGVAQLAQGLIIWFARDMTDTKARRAIVWALLISDVAGLIVSSWGTFSGVMNASGWSAVAIYVFFGLAYAYFLCRNPEIER